MNRKLLLENSNRNLGFGVLTILATINFMVQIYTSLLTIRGGVLNNIQYSIFALTISVTQDSYSHVYTIVNYPLIPILVSIIYNIYIIFKNYRNKI